MYRSKRKDSLHWETTELQSIIPRCKLLADVKERTERKTLHMAHHHNVVVNS